MIEYLSFEVCKSNKRSRFIKIEVEGQAVLLTTAHGYRGMYSDESFTSYTAPIEKMIIISELLQHFRVYLWPKAVPADYKPGNYLIGRDVDSWSIDYRELGKKRTRHINGKGEYLIQSPYAEFLKCIDEISPEKDWLIWYEDGTIG